MGSRATARLVLRVKIALLAAEGHTNQHIAGALHTSRQTVRLWRYRVVTQRLPGLVQDAPRGGRPPRASPLHLIADNYATHKHPTVQRWLARHSRIHMHFPPTSSSWLNFVERVFGDLTAKQLRRGVSRSVPELIAAIDAYMTQRNAQPTPFAWTKTAQNILVKVNRARIALNKTKTA